MKNYIISSTFTFICAVLLCGTLSTAAHAANLSEKETMDNILYGGPHKTTVANLTAGPIRVKFQDGELRYLYVGDREIIRRVYFAVRDKRFDTTMPVFDKIAVQQRKDGFHILLSATCKSDTADYRWTGEMTGKPDGTITFSVNGQANSNFQSPRVGINILYGVQALQGHSFDAIDVKGKPVAMQFPHEEVIPGILTNTNFSSLSYNCPDGMVVACRMTGLGFGLEDQRNYGDSSYKAYHSLNYKYPSVAMGDVQSDTLTIEVKNVQATAVTRGPVHVQFGQTSENSKINTGMKLPKISSAEAGIKADKFSSINNARRKYQQATSMTWEFNPAAHMPDEDTFMENLPAIVDQVRMVRAIAPQAATIRVAPINFDAPYPRAARDPRNLGLFAAAWSAAVVANLAQTNVDEAEFTVGSGAAAVLEQFTPLAGYPVLPIQLTGPNPMPIAALAVQHKIGVYLWLINKTEQAQPVLVDKLGKISVTFCHLNAQTFAMKKLPEEPAAITNGALTLTLAPYEVCRVSLP